MGKGSSKNSAAEAAMTANMQGQWNSATAQQQQIMNMTDQSTPWGDLSYNQVGTQTVIGPNGPINVPRYSATQTLSPSQQAIFDTQQQAQANLGTIAADQSNWLKDYLGKQFNIDGAPTAANISNINAPQYQQYQNAPQLNGQIGNAGDITKSYGTDYAANVQQVQDALMQRMQPQMQQDEDRTRQQLINSGLRPGTPAYNSEMERLSRQQNDARLGAVIQSGQEQSRLAGLAQNQAQFQNAAQQQQYEQLLGQATFGNNAAQQNFNNQYQVTQGNNSLAGQGMQDQLALAGAQDQSRQQYINEQTMLRNQPLNELIGLMSGSQVQNPNATYAQTPQTQVAGVDYAGIYNNINQQNTSQNNAAMGGLFGLGAAGLKLLSDERAKTDIKRVGTTDAGLPVYTYRYKGSQATHMGVMAQEAREMFPDAVGEIGGGMLGVDYGRIA